MGFYNFCDCIATQKTSAVGWGLLVLASSAVRSSTVCWNSPAGGHCDGRGQRFGQGGACSSHLWMDWTPCDLQPGLSRLENRLWIYRSTACRDLIEVIASQVPGKIPPNKALVEWILELQQLVSLKLGISVMIISFLGIVSLFPNFHNIWEHDPNPANFNLVFSSSRASNRFLFRLCWFPRSMPCTWRLWEPRCTATEGLSGAYWLASCARFGWHNSHVVAFCWGGTKAWKEETWYHIA